MYAVLVHGSVQRGCKRSHISQVCRIARPTASQGCASGGVDSAMAPLARAVLDCIRKLEILRDAICNVASCPHGVLAKVDALLSCLSQDRAPADGFAQRENVVRGPLGTKGPKYFLGQLGIFQARRPIIRARRSPSGPEIPSHPYRLVRGRRCASHKTSTCEVTL